MYATVVMVTVARPLSYRRPTAMTITMTMMILFVRDIHFCIVIDH